MKQRLRAVMLRSLERAVAAGDLPALEPPPFAVELPRQAQHGDLAVNLAMLLAGPCRMNPRAIAEVLLAHLADDDGLVQKAEVAGPGFINFFLKPSAWLAVIRRVLVAGDDYGRSDIGGGQKVLLEFVSANPTGPLHVGHGRGAVLGDVLGRLLAFTGHQVTREYYLNDAGNQMATLGRSVLIRARQAAGSGEPFPEKHYQGAYIKDLAEQLTADDRGRRLLEMDQDQAVALAAEFAAAKILEGIREDLELFGVGFDNYFSEKSLVTGGAVAQALDSLRQKGLIYDQDGATWFKASDHGDEKDRVVVRSSGEITYFASDIAYHLDKFDRGFERLIDVWGADHHGYVPRLKGAVAAAGHAPEDLEVVLVQMVNLLRGGEPVAMSTRAGEFVTLRQVVDEVGADSARFIFLTRRAEAPLDFDLEVAKAQSMDNPVFYVQYAHTRVCSVMRKAAQAGFTPPEPAAADLSVLASDDETALARSLDQFGEVVAAAAANLEPHRLTYYLTDLAGAFHSYYHTHHILVDDPDLAGARYLLAQAVGRVLAVGLGLLGVSAPEVM